MDKNDPKVWGNYLTCEGIGGVLGWNSCRQLAQPRSIER